MVKRKSQGYAFVQVGHGTERHPYGLVGNLWRIKDPHSIQIGNCFLAGRLKAGDLFLCTGHSGDCFQHYIYVEEYSNGLRGHPKWNFGSYGIGDAELVYELKKSQAALLEEGELIPIPWEK